MRALVIYESMFGNTHQIASRIAAGMEGATEVRVVSVHQAPYELVIASDIVVVGSPTHAHGLPSTQSRHSAHGTAERDPGTHTLDDDATGEGVREWFHHLPAVPGIGAAAFDTRFDGPALLTGRASHGISTRLARHGFTIVADPTSFLVDRSDHLVEGELERAEAWGRLLTTG